MATTTATAFDEFKSKLLLTELQKGIIKSRRDTAASYLTGAFPSTSDMPVGRIHLIGSAERGTIIRPLNDIDVLAEFTNKGNVFERYRHDSQAFLYRIRDALSRYQVQIVGARGQAVRLFYNPAPHVDIAPVFKWNGGGYGLPNGRGGWLTTDPDYHATYLSQRNDALSNNLKSLTRMLKRWNNVHSHYLKSFHLEVLVSASFVSLGSDSRAACEIFFGYAKDHLFVDDPAGHSRDLSSYLTWTTRQNVVSNMRSAQERASNANAAEARGDHKEAIRFWRIVFGDEFPAYG
jgi:hypothetical protein